jgi:hypothetical protein
MDTCMQLGKEIRQHARRSARQAYRIYYPLHAKNRSVFSFFFVAFLVAGRLLLFYDLATEIEKEEPSLFSLFFIVISRAAP